MLLFKLKSGAKYWTENYLYDEKTQFYTIKTKNKKGDIQAHYIDRSSLEEIIDFGDVTFPSSEQAEEKIEL